MIRIKYISILDNIKKERQSYPLDKITKKIAFKEKILDARKWLSPFNGTL